MIGAMGLGFCALLRARGMPFHRWGTLSFAYTVFGFATAVLAVSGVLMLQRALPERICRMGAISGVASFLVVPVHCGIVALVHTHAPSAAVAASAP